MSFNVIMDHSMSFNVSMDQSMSFNVSIIGGDNKVQFVLDQHPYFNNNSTSSLKQQSTDRKVSPLVHIILIPSQPVFELTP
jgi:hypothetical protein